LFEMGERGALTDLLRLLKSRQYRVRCGAASTLANLELAATEHAQVRAAVDAALAIEPTVAACSSLESARRTLRRPTRNVSPRT
jgi:hypothetical protein